MLATMTDTSAQEGEVSQSTGPMPTACSAALTTPESLLSIHDQVEADTISGRSHGTRNSARRTDDSGKCLTKNTASASPIEYWRSNETPVKITVCSSAGQKVGSWTTSL